MFPKIIEKITEWSIVAATLYFITWDFFAYFRAGTDATESTTVGTWFQRSKWILAAWMLLTGHLVASGPRSLHWSDVVVIAVCLPLGYFLTRY